MRVPYYVGKGNKPTKIGGYFEVDDGEAWVTERSWKLSNGYPCESGQFGRRLHVILAELILGRALEPGEEVHHCDENRLNARRFNLEVMGKVDHLRHSHKFRQNGLPANVYQLPSGRFRVGVTVNGVWTGVGSFDSIEEAVGARDRVLKED